MCSWFMQFHDTKDIRNVYFLFFSQIKSNETLLSKGDKKI